MGHEYTHLIQANSRMLSLPLVIAASLIWLGLLFAVAIWGERKPGLLKNRWNLVYGLSLAIHCTSWTFYGTVSQASSSGWWLPPTFVGAIALYVLGAGLMRRLVTLTRRHNAASLADLIGARLGRHSGLAALVTLVMLLAIIPYIALQLKAVTMSFEVVVRGQGAEPRPWQDSALYVALAMALFAILFGTRQASSMLHNRGLILAVAFESLLKLLAMLLLAGLLLPAWLQLEPGQLAASGPSDTTGFSSLILLGALAMFAMPHQFHVAVTECRDPRQIRSGRWLFPLYLVLIALPILPLARLGDALLRPAGVSPDLYVLALPMQAGYASGTLLAFLGGLSAATSMVVVATLALSLMVANHFIAPLHVLAGWGRNQRGDLRGAVLVQRRLAILSIVLLAWAYSRLVTGSDTLADIGATSFSALAGLAPATLAAVYRPHLGARAAAAGLIAGTLVWLYVLLPALYSIPPEWMQQGPLGWAWLAPDRLFGLGDWGRLSRAVTLNLGVNLITILLLIQTPWGQRTSPSSRGRVSRSQLHALALRFLPHGQVAELFIGTAAGQTEEDHGHKQLLARVEHELAAVIGASSAHLLLDVVRQQRPADLDQVASIVDQAAQDLRFSQKVLQAALQNMSQGICVVDGEQRVVAWNQPYAQLFNYPPGLLRLGSPIADLLRHNISRGLIGPVDEEAAVARRLRHMRQGTPHQSERRLRGAMIEIRGNPMPGGGYVATFTDVTRFRQTEDALKRSNETLEQRVEERTRELAHATRVARQANEAKGHFLAAVSHDLLQPLHAAQLFSRTLEESLDDPARIATANHLVSALGATEDLLASLLEMAHLEGGELESRPRVFALRDILAPLEVEFSALAAEAGVSLRVAGSADWVLSDPQLLRRILQNFLANALRHAGSGRVMLAVRREGRDQLRLEVRDDGPGISSSEQALIFQQFRRGQAASGQGLGLGLAIAERMAQLLDHRLGLRSRPGRGSVFSVTVPRARPAAHATTRPEADAPSPGPAGHILIVDNDASARTALAQLLESWGWTVHAAAGMVDPGALPLRPDALVLDYHLDHGLTGLEVLARLRTAGLDLPTVVLTADRSAELRQRLRRADVIVLHKPLRPLGLRQWLRRILPP